MKKKFLISIVVVSVFLLSGIGLAGVDPEPFTPYINQLDALVNILNSALDRVEKVMGVEPEPFRPDLIGAVNRLEAIENQLILANDMVVSIAEEVMGIEPEPFSGDLGLAFEDVQTAAKNIVSFINNNPVPDQLISAFGDVQLSAQAIVGTVNLYIEPCPCWRPSELNSVTSENQLSYGSCPGANPYPFVIANVVGSTPEMEGGFATAYEYYGLGEHRCSTRDYSIVLMINDEEYIRCAEQIADRCTEIGSSIPYPQ